MKAWMGQSNPGFYRLRKHAGINIGVCVALHEVGGRSTVVEGGSWEYAREAPSRLHTLVSEVGASLSRNLNHGRYCATTIDG